MLDLGQVDCVGDPVEADYEVDYRGDVIDPDAIEGEVVAEEDGFGGNAAHTPVHADVPEGCVGCVYEGEDGEWGAVFCGVALDTVQAQHHVIYDTEYVLAEVGNMGEDILGIPVSTNAL